VNSGAKWNAGHQKIFDAHGELANANSGGMMDCVGNGSGDAGEADLSHAAGA
jgi:hypothetical protein